MKSNDINSEEKKNLNIKKMALLLKEGHTLLSEACPQCNSPIFKMKSGEIYCAVCDKRVIIVKDEDQIDNIVQNTILDDVTKTITMKIKELNEKIESEKNLDDLHELSRLLLNYLDLLGKLKDLKRI